MKAVSKDLVELVLDESKQYKHCIITETIYSGDWKTKLIDGVPRLDAYVFWPYEISSGFHPSISYEEIRAQCRKATEMGECIDSKVRE